MHTLLSIRQSYLRSQPFGDLLIPGVSLYDLASAIYATHNAARALSSR